jgi:glycosyltransferase involved in cell wall biosynthesis
MPEVAGGTALLVDPLDTDDMASAIARVMENESMRQRMIEAGKKHAEPCTWASSCEQYFKLYEELIN